MDPQPKAEPSPLTRRPPFPRAIALDDIEVPPDRLRGVSPERVEVMASSFGAIGQSQPIIVRGHPDVTKGFLLVDGEHRYETARRLGWNSIRAEVHDLDDIQARLAEVDANLVREDLSALDQAMFLAERKRTWDAIYPELRGGDRRSKAARSKLTTCQFWSGSFSKDAAQKTNLNERSVFRALALADGLDPEAVRLLRHTRLAENRAALRQLALLVSFEQVLVAREIALGHARTLDMALVAAGLKPAPAERDREEELFNRLVTLVGRSRARTKRRLLDHLAIALEVDLVERDTARDRAA